MKQSTMQKYIPSLVCGLMTGTSLDGIDVAMCYINSDSSDKYHLELKAFEMIAYPNGFSDFIAKLLEQANWADISFLNFAIPQLYYKAIIETAKRNQIALNQIQMIGMHGQTVWHSPNPIVRFGLEVASTLQLGNGSALAKLISIPVISDFRSGDVILGGQGAPLVPRFDYDFFHSNTNNVICLNIGGMANITYLAKGGQTNQVLAFDTGPGNILINIAMQKYFNLEYDNAGAIARSGVLCYDLLEDLMSVKFITRNPPKSTGRELFNNSFIERHIQKYRLEPKDIISTLTHFTAHSIAYNIKLLADNPDEIVISGGGAKNVFLVELLQKQFQNSIVNKSDEYGIPIEAKEAMAFAYLAWRTANNMPSNMPSVTGASSETVLGSCSMV